MKLGNPTRVPIAWAIAAAQTNTSRDSLVACATDPIYATDAGFASWCDVRLRGTLGMPAQQPAAQRIQQPARHPQGVVQAPPPRAPADSAAADAAARVQAADTTARA